MFGICVTAPVRSDSRSNFRRVYPNRNWFTAFAARFQVCSAARLSARVTVLPIIAVVMFPLPSGSGVAGGAGVLYTLPIEALKKGKVDLTFRVDYKYLDINGGDHMLTTGFLLGLAK